MKAASGGRQPDGGDPRRAGPGRGRRQRRAGRLPGGAPPAVRRRRRPPHVRRDPDRHGTDRPSGVPALGRRARRHDAREGPGQRVPIGAMVAREACAAVLIAGTHGTTFGGPSRPRSAWRPSRRCSRTGCPSAPIGWGRTDRAAPRAGGDRPGDPRGRGKGLLIGIELDRPAGAVVDACRDRGLLVLTAGEKILRMTPPLIVDEGDADRAVAIVGDALRRPSREAPALDRGPLGPDVEDLFRSPPSGRPGRRPARRQTPLAGHSLALVFEKPSLRTRVTFEVGMAQLGVPPCTSPARTSDSGAGVDRRRRPEPRPVGGRRSRPGPSPRRPWTSSRATRGSRW